jgi:DNA-binding SARP family transcriptional activator
MKLALEPNTVVSTDRLIEMVWGDHPPESALATLRGLISRLRKTYAVAIRASGPGYVLDIDCDRIGTWQFERLAAQGRDRLMSGDPAAAARLFAQALALWRGPTIGGDTAASWPLKLATASGRLDDARLGELTSGRATDALARLEQHVDRHPLYRLGRQAYALAASPAFAGSSPMNSGSSPVRSCVNCRPGSCGRI